MSSPSPFRTVVAATRHRNFRLFLIGQFVSLCGTWMQTVAQGWLVLQLTDSAFAVGLVTTLGSLPILCFTLYGGVIADRVEKRRFILMLQALMLLEALALAVLTHLGLITVEWVMALAVLFGLLSAFEVPTRQAFVAEIVGREDLMNAIALSSMAFNVARVIGPAIAGALIATVGLAACFYANAASYVAVLASLLLMRVERRRIVRPKTGALESLREGLAYVFGDRWAATLVLLIAVFSIFGFPLMTMLPVFAKEALGLDARGYGALVSAVGVGAAGAAVFMAAFGARTRRNRLVLGSSTLFGASLVAGALAPEFVSALVLFTLAGCMMALNGISVNTSLQGEAPDHLRGRVMGFYSFVVLGVAPFGSLQAGWVAEHFGARTSLALGGVVCFVAALVAAWRVRDVAEPRRAHEVVPADPRPGEYPIPD